MNGWHGDIATLTATPSSAGGIRRARIGLLALATDLASESDLPQLLPDDVDLYAARLDYRNPVTVETLRAMAGSIESETAKLLPGGELDAVIYGCTSGTAAIGEGEIARLIHQVRPGIAVTTPLGACREALRSLEVRRVAVLTPYTPAVTRSVVEQVEGFGCSVTNVACFDLESDYDMAALSPEALLEGGRQVLDEDADALFVSCTALRASGFVDLLENRLGRPVVASNQALAWHAIRLMGRDDAVAGAGRLMHMPLPGDSA
ncbi:MAG: maleate cis-trans isomerase family protein [Pseudomonadota bacterium]